MVEIINNRLYYLGILGEVFKDITDEYINFCNYDIYRI